MFSLILGFFSDLFYYIALGAIVIGTIVYAISYFTLLLPGVNKDVLKILGTVLILLGGAYVSDHHGYERRVAEDQAEIERLNTEARAKEVELKGKLAQAQIKLKGLQNAIKTKTASINARIDSGELRFPSTCGVQADTSPSSGNGNATTESTRQAIKDIVQIAADGDSAIVSLNSCIARYEQVMQTVNEGVK